MSALNRPLLHFLLFGALLFAGRQVLSISTDAELYTIRISASDLERLQREWARETGRASTPAELQASTQRFIDEELLLREALRLGLDAADAVARERLIGNMRFAFPESHAPDGELLTMARALGMPARDLVVRRRLVQVAEMRLTSTAEVDEAALRAYVAQHSTRYAQAARYSFRHAFFTSGSTAAELELRALRKHPDRQPEGDPFLLGERFASRPLDWIERNFGAEFAQVLARAETGAWNGPVASPYGLHLLWVDRAEPGSAPDFERVRERAAYALLAEREKQILREQLDELRKNYRVEVPHGDLVSRHSREGGNLQGRRRSPSAPSQGQALLARA